MDFEAPKHILQIVYIPFAYEKIIIGWFIYFNNLIKMVLRNHPFKEISLISFDQNQCNQVMSFLNLTYKTAGVGKQKLNSR